MNSDYAHHEQLQMLPDHSLEAHMSWIGDTTFRVEEEVVHCLTCHSGPCADKR